MKNKEKIAVLGGGISSLTSILELTKHPDWQEKYDITLYQMGWRIGGKGASGRNRKISDRIEEHGLHLWFGFYDNAFDTIQQVYKENNRPKDRPMAIWTEAFKPYDFVVLEDCYDATYTDWCFKFPMNNKIPGASEEPLPTIPSYFFSMISWTFSMWKVYQKDYSINRSGKAGKVIKKNWLLDLLVSGAEWCVNFTFNTLERILGVIMILLWHFTPLGLLTFLWNPLFNYLKKHTNKRRGWVGADFGISVLKGIVFNGILWKGFDCINHLDFRAWLKKNGAAEITLMSGPTQGVYGLVFTGNRYYQGPDPVYKENKTFEAGTALRGAMRLMFTYNGAIYYRMMAGMGDVIFGPIYEVLKKRGVKFKYFHKVKNLKLSADKSHIAEVEMEEQVKIKGDKEYEPLYDVKGLPCWPSEPFFDQLVNGEEIEEKGIDLESYYNGWDKGHHYSLKYGEDYDKIIFGISIGAIPFICKEILDHNEQWRKMVKKVTATPTQALQLWFKPDVSGLGYKYWNQCLTLVGSYEEPYDTWADMSDVIIRESWVGNEVPNNIAYLCGPLYGVNFPPDTSDTNFPAKSKAMAYDKALDFMRRLTMHIWPRTWEDRTDFNWSMLVAPKGGIDEERFKQQFFRANTEPSELYVLSEVGSSDSRLKTDESGYHNMLITGDWTSCNFNAGCIEASVMAGKLTAIAISHDPSIIIYGADE